MPWGTFTDALESKYGDDIGNFNENKPCEIFLVGSYPGRSSPNGKLIIPKVLTLNNCGIREAGCLNTIEDLCVKVEELDLAQNHLDDMGEIDKIISKMPSLWFLNLSHNDLETIDPRPVGTCANIRSLVLNHTYIPWQAINSFLDSMPNVEELHLSLNNYSQVSLDPSKRYPSVNHLFVSGNPIKDWSNVVLIGQRFPCLRSLILADSDIKSIPDPKHWYPYFGDLECLSLNNGSIQHWRDVDYLNGLARLEDIRLQGLPLLNNIDDLNEKERRQHLIARLPCASRLNGSVISSKEREDAERAFIRYYMDKKEKPDRFYDLENIHGKLEPLANVDLSPRKTARVVLCFYEQKVERVVNLHMSVHDLKMILSQVFGLPIAKMRVFYVDVELSEIQETVTAEELKYTNKKLYTYNIQDGDQFLVHEK